MELFESKAAALNIRLQRGPDYDLRCCIPLNDNPAENRICLTTDRTAQRATFAEAVR
jgi:hypothetical protein